MRESLPPLRRVDDACPDKQLCTDLKGCCDALLLMGDINDAKKRVISWEVVLMLKNRMSTFSCASNQAEFARKAAQEVIDDYYNDR